MEGDLEAIIGHQQGQGESTARDANGPGHRSPPCSLESPSTQLRSWGGGRTDGK